MAKTILIPILLALLISGCQDKACSLSEKQSRQIETEVDVLFQHMIRLAEKVDYDGLSIGVDDKYNAGFISDGQYYSNYDSLIKTIKPRAIGISSQSISLSTKKITVLAPTLVLLTAAGITNAKTDSGRVFSVNFQWSFLYEKIDGAWKVVHSHQSTSR